MTAPAEREVVVEGIIIGSTVRCITGLTSPLSSFGISSIASTPRS